MNNKELIKSGFEKAKELTASCGAVDMSVVAQMLRDLATQLDLQRVRADTLAADNENALAVLKEANQAVLRAKASFDGMAAELSAVLTDRAVILEDFDDTCFEIGMQKGEKLESYPVPVVVNHDAFLAEVRASGVEMFAEHCQKRRGEMMKSEPNEAASNEAITAIRRAGEFALFFAAQLRQEAAQ